MYKMIVGLIMMLVLGLAIGSYSFAADVTGSGEEESTNLAPPSDLKNPDDLEDPDNPLITTYEDYEGKDASKKDTPKRVDKSVKSKAVSSE